MERKRVRWQTIGKRNGIWVCDGGRWLEWRVHPRRRRAEGCPSGLSRFERCFFYGRRGGYGTCYCHKLAGLKPITVIHIYIYNINSLYEVEDSNSVPNWGKEAGSVGAEQEVSLTVNGSQQVGELEFRLHDFSSSLWYGHSGVSMECQCQFQIGSC